MAAEADWKARIASFGDSARMSKFGKSVGYSTKEMGISEFTVRDYISSVMKKMNVRHRAQAIAEAVRSGLIS